MPVEVKFASALAQTRAVLFLGTWTEQGDTIELAPNVDPRITVVMHREDVEFRNGAPYVRVGAYALSIDIPPDSLVLAIKGDTAIADCSGGRTCCIGGAEYCCETRKQVGECKGYWSC
jgi:hypothetical protein